MDSVMHRISDEDKEILLDFINESNEAIEKSELTLLQMEERAAKSEKIDSGLIDFVFRTFHSIKGSAGFLNLNLTNSLTHQAETLLDLLRKDKAVFTKAHVDILLEVCDQLQILLDHIKDQFSEEGFTGDTSDLEHRLQELTKKDKADSQKPSPQTPAAKPKPVKNKDEKAAPTEQANTSSLSMASQKDKVPSLIKDESLITQDMITQFAFEAQEQLDTLEQDLLALEANPEDKSKVESAFRALHSLKGNAGFFNFSDIGSLAHKAETFLDLVRQGELVASARQISLIFKVLDFIRSAIQNVAQGRPPVVPGRIGLMDLMDEVFVSNGINPTTSAEEISTQSENEPAAGVAEEISTGSGNKPPTVVVEEAAPMEKETKPESAAARADDQSKKDVIRVDVEKLNKLMDLVGEIVIAESMVSHNPAIANMELESFEKSVNYLQKNIRELQDLAMSMRMIPLTGVFGKIRRLARDISEKKKNEVELVIEGAETEVDRSVIENISDPLVHIIRNSIDHGIELPDVRRQKGKKPSGVIQLEAKRVGGEIWIVIADDGAGLNKERILAKALEKGLISGNEELSDKQIYNLIFVPGLSTAKEVTSISGRGVGMDVVSRNVEKIRGRVDVDSKPGLGTTITLKIPLTTAIVDGMLMQVSEMLYAIPTLDIKESLQIKTQNVVRLTDGQEVINVRDRLIPVLRLTELHRLNGEPKTLEQGIVVVTESGNSVVGFLVDEIIGQQQLVIKPVPHYLGKVEGVSGCALLGNGDICLILDMTNLVKFAETIAIN
jgi:two-component system chemotaxis sensor kinase CheA